MSLGIERRVHVHEALRPALFGIVGTSDELEPDARRSFTVDECWSRGRYEGSLFAPSDDRSFAWRGDYIRNQFPFLPRDGEGRDIDPSSLWRRIAQLNGSPQSALQKRVGRDAATVEQVLRVAEQQDLLYRLPYWAVRGETSARSPLVYWSDSGLLHRLLGERTPATMNDPRRGKSYEGFAIAAIAAAAGTGVTARVWGRGEDEIDLILEWAGNSKRWAIEITYSKSKKLSDGFRRGCEETEASRAIVVQRKRGSAGWPDGIERMHLLDAIQEVRNG